MEHPNRFATITRGPQRWLRTPCTESCREENAGSGALRGHLQHITVPLRRSGIRHATGHLRHIGGLRPFCSLHNVELDVFAFFQSLEPFSLERGIVHKDIFPIFKMDEPKSLSIVEPLDGAFTPHAPLPSSNPGGMVAHPSHLANRTKKYRRRNPPPAALATQSLSSCVSRNTEIRASI